MGFTSVEDRFEKDQLFRAQMEEQGWTSSTIEEIEKGALKVLPNKGRSREEIYQTTGRVLATPFRTVCGCDHC